jgi:hypothetical protein
MDALIAEGLGHLVEADPNGKNRSDEMSGGLATEPAILNNQGIQISKEAGSEEKSAQTF